MPDNIELLQDAIAHWQRMVDNPDNANEYPGAVQCVLCRQYLRNNYLSPDFRIRNQCDGCPVRSHTGSPHCSGTPYAAAEEAFDRYHDGEITRQECVDALTDELEFLQMILRREQEKA